MAIILKARVMQHATDFAPGATPSYLEKLPCAKHAYSDVVNVIMAARQSIQNMNNNTNFVELELRFGRREQGFKPGITPEAFQQLEARFDTGRDWADRRDWHNITVFFHSSCVPGDHRKLRTEVTFFPDGPETKRVECTHKEIVCNHDYRSVSLTHEAQAMTDLRIALNVEHAVPPSDIPEICEPDLVHLKTRKCYFYSPTGYSGPPVWVYVLTKRWTGRTLIEAKQSQARDVPVYELELECLHPEYLLAVDAGQVAAKILYKACDLLEILTPHDRSEYVIEPIGKSMLWTRNKCP
jgi:hypothetical protein